MGALCARTTRGGVVLGEIHQSGLWDIALSNRESAEFTDPGKPAFLGLPSRETLQIALDLHDGPAQTVSAALLQLRILTNESGDAFRDELEELKELLVSASEDIYALIGQARQQALNGGTLVDHVRERLADLSARYSAEFELTVNGDESLLPSLACSAVARIIDEGVSNAAVHASAQHVHVGLDFMPDGVWCLVSDDGRGFDMGAVERRNNSRPRYGLLGMMERAELLGGACSVDTAPGCGTRLRIWIPVWTSE